jgi:hypothetical protein
MRSIGKVSGRLRGPRCGRRRGALAVSSADDLGLGLFLGLRLFQILDRQFELFDEELAPFRRLAVGLAARVGQLQLQPRVSALTG